MYENVLNSCVILTVLLLDVSEQSLSSNIRPNVNGTQRSLSRRKRYLLFPEGSSLQLVYDTTFPLIAGTTPFVFGGTAALAWQLPSELIGPLLKFKEKNHQRVDTPGTTTSGGWKSTYDSYNTGYQKISFDKFSPGNKQSSYFMPEYTHYYKPVRYSTYGYQNTPAYRQNYNRKDSHNRRVDYERRKSYYRNNSYRSPVTAYMNPIYNEIHRRTRRELFKKLQRFFTAQRKDGRACLLKAVCEVSQASDGGVGTFMEEIIKAIFRFHPSNNKEEDQIDTAANKHHNCTELYPTCDFSLWNVF